MEELEPRQNYGGVDALTAMAAGAEPEDGFLAALDRVSDDALSIAPGDGTPQPPVEERGPQPDKNDDGDDAEGDAGADDDKDADDKAPEGDADEFIEFEVGGETKRVEISEAVSALQQREQFAQDVTAVRAEVARTAANELTQFFEPLAERLNEAEDAARAMFQHLPQVEKPPLTMLEEDPHAYQMRKELYENAQAQRARLANYVGQLSAQREQANAQHAYAARIAAQEVLAKEFPEFSQPETVKAVAETLAGYGFSQDEIQKTNDYRLVMLARDAMQLQQLNSGEVGQKAVRKVKAAKAVGDKARVERKGGRRGSRESWDRFKKTGDLMGNEDIFLDVLPDDFFKTS